VRGFTLIEILVGVALASVVVFGVGSAYVFGTRGWVDHQARLQTQQQLRSAIAAISRELRLAGACMLPSSAGTPPANFRPLDGVNNGTVDSITERANPRCLTAALSAGNPCNGCTTINVGSSTGFVSGMRAYLLRNDFTGGEVFTIQRVTAGTIVATQALTGTYPAPAGNPSSVFGIDVRTFAISSTCTGCSGMPTLTLQTLDVQTPTPLVKGIDRLDITYILNRDYAAGSCDASTGGTRPLCVVTLPGSSADWKLVRVVTFNVGARSSRAVRAAGSADGFYHLGEVFEITPRNFVFSTRL
jgi:prepilin-type N-terminal cleavage/methylation domain-containing protein